MDPIRRNILATGAAATAIAAAPGVFAQQAQAQPAAAGAGISFYQKGNVRIRYQEVGTGFPLLAAPGGGLNSRISNWPNAVINVMEHFKNDFRVITMDQRNATGGESTGPVPVDDPWGAFADDQLGLMDHLGIRQFLFFGNCIGGSFALKLMERAPDRIVAGVLSQPIGERPEKPGVMYDSGLTWANRVQRFARLRAQLSDADDCPAGRHCGARLPDSRRCRIVGAEGGCVGLSLEGSAGTQGADHQPCANIPEGTPTFDSGPVVLRHLDWRESRAGGYKTRPHRR